MNTSIWLDQTKAKQYPKLEQDLQVQTLIVGAGVIGLSTAYYLSKTTSDIIIVESDQIGYGASGRNTGKISSQHGLVYKELTHTHGHEKARLYYEAQREAIDSIEKIVQEHQIDCDFQRCASLLYTQDQTKVSDFQDEYQACLDLKIPCHYVKETSYPMKISAGIQFSQQAKYNPYRYLLGVSNILDKANIPIYEHSPVKHVIKEDTGYRVLIGDVCIHANNVVLTTQYPIVDHMHLYFTRTYPEVSSLCAIPYEDALSEDMLINIEDPMCSYNHTTINDSSWLLCGGNQHPSAKENKEHSEAFLHHVQKTWNVKDIPYYWSSQDYISLDKLPLIGPLDKEEDHLYFATAMQKWGNTNGNVAAKLLCAYLLKQESQYQELFDPHRKSTIFTSKYISENFKTMTNFFKSKFPEINNTYPNIGQARVIELDHHNYGMYRDEHDKIYILDITCPHLGCVCSFNEVDKSWDCPCHGSRFTYQGEIIKGPSTKPLKSYGDGLNHIDPHLFQDQDK